MARTTSRREFLQTSTTLLTGAAFLSAGACSRESSEVSHTPAELTHRTLGRTGLTLPVVSMGACYAANLVRTALDRGIVHFHTSAGYGGNNQERMLGQVFKGRPRDSFVVATSPDLPSEYVPGVGHSVDLDKTVDLQRIVDSIDGSLQRLGLDYVDIYYIGSIGSRDVTLYEPYLELYEKLKRDGKTRFIGVATHENEPEVIRAVTESGVWDVVLTAYNFRQQHRREVLAAIREAARAGVGVVAMKTQAGVYWDRKRDKKINMKAALKWALQDENVHTTIPAFSNYEELVEDLEVMKDLTLTDEEKRDLDLGDELGLSGCFCQQCGRCLSQCPADMHIPTLMRSYMYAFGHHSPSKARETLRSWTPADIACRDCERCDVECAFGFDVRARALDMARILEVPEELLA